MDEGDSLAFGAETRDLVDEADAGGPAFVECAIEVVDGKADMMDTGAAFGDKLADRGLAGAGLQEFDEGIPGGESGNARSVGVVERDVGKVENIAVEWQDRVELGDSHADVRDAGAAGNGESHDSCAGVGALALNTNSGAVAEAAGRRRAVSNAQAVTDADFEEKVEKAEGLTIVDFWATWCGPCRMIAPILDQLASEYADKGVTVTKLDVDANIKTATRFNVRSIPMLLFFKDGKVVDQIVGAVPRPAIEEKLKRHVGAPAA